MSFHQAPSTEFEVRSNDHTHLNIGPASDSDHLSSPTYSSPRTKSKQLLFSLSALVVALLVVVIVLAVQLHSAKNAETTPASSNIPITPITPVSPSAIDGYDPPAGYHRFSFLHLNDIYELLPLSNGLGGLARVATLKKQLQQQNIGPLTTVFGGDLISPSALGTAQVTLNGQNFTLNGMQMVATMNALGIDYAVPGNHEFDNSKVAVVLQRMSESQFTWISANVLDPLVPGQNTTHFNDLHPYIIFTTNNVRILLIGFTVDETQPAYVVIRPMSYNIEYAKLITASLAGKYDLAFGLTHLALADDIALMEAVPALSAIFGGHEHENWRVYRGEQFGGVFKAEANDESVFVHRMGYNPTTKSFLIDSQLVKIDNTLTPDPAVDAVAKYWVDLGMQGFENSGFHPYDVLTNLQSQWDGRSSSVRSESNSLTRTFNSALISLAPASVSATQTVYSFFNGGAIRIDDFLIGNITQYDFLRIWPYGDVTNFVMVPAATALACLNQNIVDKQGLGDGMYLQQMGFQYQSGDVWFDAQGNDLSKSTTVYPIMTTGYYHDNTILSSIPVPADYVKQPFQLSVINWIKIHGSAA